MNGIIVSLTTYPARIKGIQNVLDSIMAQTYKPDKVVLSLSEEQFLDRSLPVDLSVYLKQGLEIHWCQGDMKSHKKYLYAFQEYSDDYIITIDDDFYYEKHMIEELIRGINKFPGCVLARRTHLITADPEGNISEYNKWWSKCLHYIGVPRMDLFAVGCGGILYPPHLFTEEVFHADCIREYCMHADDIWLKVMELISNIPVVQMPTRFLDRSDEGFAQDGLYQQHNISGGNDRSLHLLLKKYNDWGGMKESLTDRIFSTGTVCENEIKEKRSKDNARLLEEWTAGIGKGMDIVIYGAGVVAKRVYNVLKKFGMVDRIRTFAVGDIERNVSDWKGVEVVQYKAADYRNAVCIIALSGLNDQYRIYEQLLAAGLEENQLIFLNDGVLSGLRDLGEDDVN